MKALKTGHSILLTLIGLVSLFMTTSIIFDLFGIRALEGNYVPFVVYANWACGIIYLYAARMNFVNLNKSIKALIIALTILIITFIAAGIYIKNGGIYENQMPRAMTGRTIFTAVMLALAYLMLKKEKAS